MWRAPSRGCALWRFARAMCIDCRRARRYSVAILKCTSMQSCMAQLHGLAEEALRKQLSAGVCRQMLLRKWRDIVQQGLAQACAEARRLETRAWIEKGLVLQVLGRSLHHIRPEACLTY